MANDETRAAANLDDFAGHTRGPWKVERRWSNECEIVPRITCERDADRGCGWIADAIGAPYLGHQSTLPNARLIAAAPDLLAEVRRLRTANAELAAALRLSLDAMDAIDACLSQIGVGYFPIAEHKRKSAERAGEAALARHDAGKGGAAS